MRKDKEPVVEAAEPTNDAGEQMLLPCEVHWAGEVYGAGAVTITSASMRRALERAVENSGYSIGEPIEQVETPADLPAGEQVGEGS